MDLYHNTDKDSKLDQEELYDCIIFDDRSSEVWVMDCFKQWSAKSIEIMPPIVLYIKDDLDQESLLLWTGLLEKHVSKIVQSEVQLLDKSYLFLHQEVKHLPITQKEKINELHEMSLNLENTRVLLVDDDVRNIFAITELLELKGIHVTKANNGLVALDHLEAGTFDLILMDIMMPGLDGYETMKRIRSQEKYKDLPIIAVTANAMKGDRSKCIEAGANDYLMKPINEERLFTLINYWIHKSDGNSDGNK